jgi:pimeloyl-ACP methyl ester carboxylesterase
MIVVGFTGGLEGRDSSVSGVVRMRRTVGAHVGDTSGIVTLTYNNFRWREARSDVLNLARHAQEREDVRRADRNELTVSRVSLEPEPRLRQPLIVVYGHSWGGGSIAKFARALGDEGLDISLAIYIDAFTVRNPRLPPNIRYAVNFYQRAGVLRGLPLRGKRQLIPESPEATIVLGSHRIKPVTDHFGWNWNLIQPLLYRHHHRISHDVRLQQYLLRVIEVLELRVEEEAQGAQQAAARDEIEALLESVALAAIR